MRLALYHDNCFKIGLERCLVLLQFPEPTLDNSKPFVNSSSRDSETFFWTHTRRHTHTHSHTTAHIHENENLKKIFKLSYVLQRIKHILKTISLIKSL